MCVKTIFSEFCVEFYLRFLFLALWLVILTIFWKCCFIKWCDENFLQLNFIKIMIGLVTGFWNCMTGIQMLCLCFVYLLKWGWLPLHKKCPYSELFWSIFSRIQTKYVEIQSISLYSVRMLENTTRATPNTDTFYAL